ncbi:class I SAM-dependent RNA methyltransferase [Clostridium sp. 19966]|uniref:THUMP domain-containing class I SAM-dependent RNA methyltransferase n=1 Tax=Clostridium sp. 19966 TaxID=2768166 RepID=UPI0028E091FC|nr:class I SAM-dependent RNA methyltransferase [Clostridium sp. 19966]MDT8716604.1 class I SAM-dependent RNA methyltransferase [Clostridium sp. 19966]
MEYELIATSTFGIEAITARELKDLGYDDLKVENGKVTFKGDDMDVAITNIWLRTADRILIKIKEFTARSFEELFQGTVNIPWGDIIPVDGKMHVVGKSIKSTLFSVSDCQSIVKKAVVESMKHKYKRDWFEEDGPIYKIEVALLKDVVTLTIDTSGAGLHKRGYRENAGAAPLKETLAAALVIISKWDNSKVLSDVFCGSGTIPIEAAMIGRNMAPGINRSFVCEEWPSMDPAIWNQVREGARKAVNSEDFKIFASDIDGRVLKTAKENAEKAGISQHIFFQKLPMQEFSSSKKGGYIITNPPYGERLGEKKEVEELYKILGSKYEKLNNWQFYVLTAYEGFENIFGYKSSKNRKLYNGKIKCYYYQYMNK